MKHKPAKMNHNPGKGHKKVKSGMQHEAAEHLGANLKLKDPSQAMHVKATKDKMAANVGGSAHMMPDAKSMGHQDLQESGASVKRVREKY